MALAISIFILLHFSLVCADEVDYYVQLINDEIERTNYFELPKDASEYKPNRTGELDGGEWDYIIIGGGSAGSVITNRLSEDENIDILLIEAGDHESDFSDIPSMSNYLQLSKYNWGFYSTRQTTCFLGMINNQCAVPRGKALGGSSVINNIKYTRGNRRDYDYWAEEGNRGWAYKDVLPLFKKSENVQFPADLHYHGTCGNLYVEHEKPVPPQQTAFIKAHEYYGRNYTDYNAKMQLGVSDTQFTTKYGRRDSTGKAFIRPVLKRPNVTILKNSYVVQILINETTKQAYGVKYSSGGILNVATIRKEVILCAGTIKSPHILMLSGIGPSSHLREFDIPVIQDLPVGNNFQDHPGYLELHVLTNYSEPVTSLRDQVEKYLNDLAPLTVSTRSYGISFVQTKYSQIPGVPDVEIVMNPSNCSVSNNTKLLNYRDDVNEAIWGDVNVRQTFRLYAILLHEKSRGTLRLQSNDPYDYPLIDFNFFSDENGEDIQVLYEGIKMALELLEAPSFKRLNATLVNNTIPQCRELEYLSKEYWYCQIRHLAYPFYHPLGTCKMGPCEAVVNQELKVYGIENLRVADASIIPQMISGHTNVVSIMIGEKLSEMLKREDNVNVEY